ncbi:MAG: glycoside hydrolase family 18 protein [Bacteroidota bacterium]|nr:glycoside hydrolase family 18 protein [Bacteroidota bacterium]
MIKFKYFFLGLVFCITFFCGFSQSNKFLVVAYYGGNANQIDSFQIEKLTHIIFSFAHLKGNQLNISNARDSATIKKLDSLKIRKPNLKVMISLGGWSGCPTCSDIFSSKKDRKAFAQSVERIISYFGIDGIDLDWEYPAIEGFPSHKYKPEDKENFTKLINRLRKTLGKKYEISFAAGGFTEYIEKSIDWKRVMKKVDFVNLMTYDLVSGYANKTGHHTALYSTTQQYESTNRAVTELINDKVPKNKIVIGAAFYAKVWENVPDSNFGLYQTGKYKMNVDYKNFNTKLSSDSGFIYHWDEEAQAPFLYNPAQKLFATFDDKKSIELKTKYLVDKGLGGIMFWELPCDTFKDGLLEVIDQVKSQTKKPDNTK